MARANDHDQRDAEHALRAEIGLHLARYSRRMLAQGQAYIADAIAQAVRAGEEIDGHTIGRAAAAKARMEFFKTSIKPAPPIESSATVSAQLESGEGGREIAG